MTEYNKNFDWESWSKKFDSAVAANSSIDSLLIMSWAQNALGRGLEGDAFIAFQCNSIMSCIETEELTEAEGYKDLYKIQPADK